MIDNIDLPESMKDAIIYIYNEAKKRDPSLTESRFFQVIISQWMELYLQNKKLSELNKNNVKLYNNLKSVIKVSGKTQRDIANEIGLNDTYLSHIIRGKYDPSITIVLLLMQALDYPLAKLNDVFYLEPMS